jgi:endonuclease VIII
MPEGHTIHRLAKDHAAVLVGHELDISSPQGRMAASAAILDGQVLAAVDPYGKHLFYRFGSKSPQRATTVHVHLGLFGKFREQPTPEPPKGQVRLRMVSPIATVDLSGPTDCRILDLAEEQTIRQRLGPDPIRRDANAELAWDRIRKSRRTIGEALMDQKVMAGVGNVFRAESLFVHGIHPQRSCQGITREEFDSLWSTITAMLRQGVIDARIITVSKPEIATYFGKSRSALAGKEAVYVYKRDRCLRCETDVRRWDLAGRWAYACETCQPR